MASYFTVDQKTAIRGLIDNVHDTFKQEVTLILPPLQTIDFSNSFSSVYGANSTGSKNANTPREQTIQARILYKDANVALFEDQVETPFRIKLPVGSVRLKVDSSSNDLIKDAIKVKIGNRFYEIVNDGQPTMMFTEHYYIWLLKPSDVE